MVLPDPLTLFLPPVQEWFRQHLGEPTPAQAQGWPNIVAGRNTLILAPTGSGKTLAAFLGCLDGLWRLPELPREVRVLYISPLKALNNDIYRNLQVPLAGVTDTARRRNFFLPEIDIALRTGDTTAAERQRMLRRPPQVLITTPESLHLLLTSRARDTLRGVTHCIVDEIHALCPNKRGVFLSLLLERLSALNRAGDFVRIGLSATQRPLEEVARFLGGFSPSPGVATPGALLLRPVTIVDAGLRKNLDLRVVSPVEQFGPLPEKSIWPSIYRLLKTEISQHRSTIIFANNRRSVERITAQLNEDSEPEALAMDSDNPSLALRAPNHLPVARAHHGSVALEVRQATEQALKEGRLPAVVATASLELGIDMGAVDLVCQVESPGNVARGLQRVGRAGHLVGQTSKGRLIPKTLPDLLEQAVLAAEMAAGRVEELRVPGNCLDVLAQQIIAMVAMEPWEVPALFALVRRAYPFRDLTPAAFEAVLEMVTGRYRFQANDVEEDGQRARNDKPSSLTALQPRISWDRVHNRLLPLPGSQRLALVSGGTIPDTGQYGAYTTSGVRIGELDEEFIYERRVGDTFLLGTNAWRLEEIQTDRVVVSPAAGAPAMVPFWRGEQTGRSYDLGIAQGQFLRELAGRLDAGDCLDWLQQHYFLDAAAARNLRWYVRRQHARTGCLPTDRTLIIEASRNQLGDWQVVLLSPLGQRFHLGLRLAVENALRRRLGYSPQCLHHNDGILIRLTDSEEPILDILEGITPENVQDLVLEELADSPLFALRFRQNAARALLFPRGGGGQRAPLWLQRLRGRDLLQVARRHADFPIVIETFRECLHDHLEVPRVVEFLADLQAGKVEVVTRRLETPSPFAASLLFAFTMAYMYQYDDTEAEPSGTFQGLDRHLLDQLVAPSRPLLDPRAVHQVERRLRGLGQPPRHATEMAEWLRRLGDVAASDLEGPMAGFVQELVVDGRACQINLPTNQEPLRWILAEEAERYQLAFSTTPDQVEERQQAAEAILARFLETHALVGLSDILARYPFEQGWTRARLEEWGNKGRLVRMAPVVDSEPLQWSAPANLEQIQRGTLALLRREVLTCPAHQFAHFLCHWQGLLTNLDEEKTPTDHLAAILDRLQALQLPANVWEQTILPSRLNGYQTRWLDDVLAGGQWTWMGKGGEQDQGPGHIAFVLRETMGQLPPPALENAVLDATADRILECLRTRGALFLTELAQAFGLDPRSLRTALWQLIRLGLVTNDHFNVVRRGESTAEISPRAPRSAQLEGRWSLLPWARPEVETQAIFLAGVLLKRYGIVARELALLDPAMLPWRILYEVLSRMELAGQVRRGYYVEGLSGAQFALPEAARLLQDLALPSSAAAPVVLVHSQDPANLYGQGAPFDILGADGEPHPFGRRSGNWLILRAGWPLLLIELQGRRLTSLPAAQAADLTAAIACLPHVLARDRGLDSGRKITVEEWNGQPVTSTPGRDLLESAGFVRDYQAMTLYATWR